MREVFLVGVGATGFGDASCAHDLLVGEAVSAALADAGIRAADLTAATIGVGERNGRAPALPAGTPPPLGRPNRWAGRAFQRAWQAVAAGEHDLVLCVGSSRAATDPRALPIHAAAARHYMERTDATPEHLARVTVKNRALGAQNPRVLDRAGAGVDVATVLDSEVVAWPLRRLMVARPSCGAAAVILASRVGVRHASGEELRVRASVLLSGIGADDATARAARLAYQTAGVAPEKLDCAELDDHTAAGELAAYEALQFAPAGQGPELVDSGFTDLGGVLPVNTSGGLLSQGDATGASALAQLCELSWQLRGEAGPRQVEGAATGLALSAYETAANRLAFVSLVILGV